MERRLFLPFLSYPPHGVGCFDFLVFFPTVYHLVRGGYFVPFLVIIRFYDATVPSPTQ